MFDFLIAFINSHFVRHDLTELLLYMDTTTTNHKISLVLLSLFSLFSQAISKAVKLQSVL